MYKVTKRMEVSSAHHLDLPYPSKCSNVHGHNWIIEVEISSAELDENGMVVDFTHIEEIVDELDHINLNEFVIDKNPTVENIATWIKEEINMMLKEKYDTPSQRAAGQDRKTWVSKVTIQESEGNTVCYTP